MGQRSQIYVRINNEKGQKILIPRYYQWNFGTRMISRARGIIEWAKDNNGLYYLDLETITKLTRIMDTNFDYKDVVLGRNIIEEWQEYFKEDPFADAVFSDQDNNDGQFLLDVIVDHDSRKPGSTKKWIKFKYAFLPYTDPEPMTGEEYMEWDEGSARYPEEPVWRENQYLKGEIKYTERNIRFIEKNAKLMTKQEVLDYINYGYVADMGL